MITNMNALISGTGAADRSQLVEQLVRRVDTNRDGQVTSAEFSNFLSSLMQSLDEETAADRGVEAPIQRAAAGDTSPALLSVSNAGALTRAQGTALLRQAFETVTRGR